MRTAAAVLFRVVSQIETGAFEYKSRAAGDFPLRGRTADRADLNRRSHNALELFKLVAVLADVLVCGHDLIQVLVI